MSEIKTGDLVLRDGKVEEVTGEGRDHISTYWKLWRGMGRPQVIVRNEPFNTSSPPLWSKPENLVRIGSTHDGWRIHTGSERPADVGEGDSVQIYMLGNGLGKAKGQPASTRTWHYCGDSTIVAYRVISLTVPVPSTPSTETPAATFTAEPILPVGVKLSDIKAVAEEMRKVGLRRCFGDENLIVNGTQLASWADLLDPPPPAPLKAGDKCAFNGIFGTVAYMGETVAVFRSDGGLEESCSPGDLERVS